ncbi:DUF4880 domain-containing protein [Bradyrhizobium sp. WSM3983]|uniref:FecR/PupR family sigma factor regulator n=1 Tax=Bradyrhizobium sp. WSM3983 TaxID=1038867 RepID=UPI000A03DF69
MPKRDQHPDPSESLVRDAIVWVVHLNSGDATVADVERIMDWRARSQAHENAFRDAVRCWRAIGAALANGPVANPDHARRKPRRKPRA